MTKRLQGFYIYKFSSKRLSKSKFRIEIDLKTARKNSEVVKLGDSAFLDVVRRVTNHPYNLDKLKQLDRQRKEFQKQENKEQLLSVLSEIDKQLHIPEVVEISFDNATHYKKIFEQGLFINGEKYVRILAGAANLRKQVVFFVQEKYKDQINNILDCGRNKNQLFNIPKFSAYYGLYNSSGHSLSYPKFIVVPDAEYTRMVKVDWVNDNNEIEEIEKEIKFNLFDGQGLILPSLSAKWAKELELNWTPSTWILRAPFLKGSFVTFSFDEFGEYVAQKEHIRDVWGNEVSIDGIELIVSASQFKLWDSYPNQYSYEQAMKQSGLGFRSSRYSQPCDKMKTVSAMNYMFVQVLDLNKNDIEKLCQPTIDYFYDLMGGNREKMLTFLYPDNPNINFNSLEPEIQALMLDADFAKEPSIQKKFINSLRKKVKESYLGNIYVEGNYQSMISDPYAQAEHIFGLDVIGLLDENQNYCQFWNERNVDLVGSARSPLTHFSEFRKSKLINNVLVRDWYRYIDNGFILNVKGFDVLLYAD